MFGECFVEGCVQKFLKKLEQLANVTANRLKSPNGTLFRTCEDGAGWHFFPYRISPRSEFFSQAYKTWHIT